MTDTDVYGNAFFAILWNLCTYTSPFHCLMCTTDLICAKDSVDTCAAGVHFAELPAAVGVVKQESSVSGHCAHLCTISRQMLLFCWLSNNPATSVNKSKWVTLFVSWLSSQAASLKWKSKLFGFCSVSVMMCNCNCEEGHVAWPCLRSEDLDKARLFHSQWLPWTVSSPGCFVQKSNVWMEVDG